MKRKFLNKIFTQNTTRKLSVVEEGAEMKTVNGDKPESLPHLRKNLACSNGHAQPAVK